MTFNENAFKICLLTFTISTVIVMLLLLLHNLRQGGYVFIGV